MLLFSAHDLAQSFQGNDIFQNVDFEVEVGEKLALVGPNGCGKTSLLRIIAGIDPPFKGRLKFYASASKALLTQHLDFDRSSNLREFLEKARPFSGAKATVGEALKKFQFIGMEHQPIEELSGGEKTRLQLAGIWLSGADFLMLDEPSNHLDTENLRWLEGYIREYPGTVLLVSHDRYFLDETVQRVLELRADGVESYPGNYSDYRWAKQERFDQAEKTYFDQEKQLRKLDAAIMEQQVWSERAHNGAAKKAIANGIKKGGKEFYRAKAKKMDRRVQSTIKRLEHLKEEQIARPKAARAIDLSFTEERRAKRGILLAEGLVKRFGSRVLFDDLRFALKYGEKVGLVGPNGSGKTTLIRMIEQSLATDGGSLWLSPTLRVGSLDQEVKFLAEGRTMLEEVGSVCTDQRRVRDLLADLLLRGDAVFKPCQVLSMGERVRVALAKLLLGSYDLLLLDEPTNYLDLPSRERLEEALEAFGGSILIVSHDRYLIERVAETIWAIEDGAIKVYPGKYSEYLQRSNTAETTMRKEKADPKAEWPGLDPLELEVKKARLIGELALLDRTKNEPEYKQKEAEFLEILQQLRGG